MREMGFTTVVEPAVSPHHALHAHLELADTPDHRQGDSGDPWQ